MPYKLKSGVPDFETVDGPMAGRKFVSGKTYETIPREEADKFEPANIPEDDPPAVPSPSRGEGQGEGDSSSPESTTGGEE